MTRNNFNQHLLNMELKKNNIFIKYMKKYISHATGINAKHFNYTSYLRTNSNMTEICSACRNINRIMFSSILVGSRHKYFLVACGCREIK